MTFYSVFWRETALYPPPYARLQSIKKRAKLLIIGRLARNKAPNSVRVVSIPSYGMIMMPLQELIK